jgi:hypothetical protein
VIVQCVSFGSHWWLRKSYDQRTGAFLRNQSAFMNTTGFKCGRQKKFKHATPGFLRINAGTKPHFDSPRELLQAKYHTEGITRYKETNRLMLVSRAPDDEEVDMFLVCVRSTSEGSINFSSDWKRNGTARIFSSSYYAYKQETLLLMKREAIIFTSLGSWRIMCPDKTSFLGLVDGR